jgi:hypothetical protein
MLYIVEEDVLYLTSNPESQKSIEEIGKVVPGRWRETFIAWKIGSTR